MGAVEMRERTSVSQTYPAEKNASKIVIVLVPCISALRDDSQFSARPIRMDAIQGSSTLLSMPAMAADSVVLTSEKLREAMRLLALSKKTLCSILDVSRPDLYSWLDSSLEPGELELKKINALYSLVEESGILEPLFRGYAETPIGGFSSSIVDCLTRKEFLDKASDLPKMLRAAEALTLERKKKIEMRREHIADLSEAEKDLILEDNLNCL